MLHVLFAGFELSEVRAAAGAEAALAPGNVAAGVGQLLRPVRVGDVGTGDAHDAPVEEPQDGGGIDVGDAGHWRDSGHVGDAAEVVQAFRREWAMLRVEGDVVQTRHANQLYEGGGGKCEAATVGFLTGTHFGDYVVYAHIASFAVQRELTNPVSFRV